MISIILLVLAVVFLVLTFVSVVTLKVGLIIAVGCLIAAVIFGYAPIRTRAGL